MSLVRRTCAAVLAFSLFLVCQVVAAAQSGTPSIVDELPQAVNSPIPDATPDSVDRTPVLVIMQPSAVGAGDLETGSLSSGRGGFSGFSSGIVGQLPFRVDYRVTWFPDEEVQGQGTNLGFVRQDFTLGFPVWQTGSEEWSASVHVRNELFHTGAVFTDTGQPFPEELWAVNFGTTYRHLFDNGWIAGGTLSVGSASDKPFHSINEMTAGVNVFLRIPQGEHNAWLFTLSYASNSELPIPIPGVAFIWQPSEQFRMNIGLPFQIMYRPIDDLTLDFSYMLLTAVHARATYRVSPKVRLFVGYDYNDESYLLADRPDPNERLFYYDQHVSGGVQYAVCRNATLEFAGGYTFDRFYFEGHSFSDQNQNRIDVGNGAFLTANFRVKW
jgi:hypothetical protein